VVPFPSVLASLPNRPRGETTPLFPIFQCSRGLHDFSPLGGGHVCRCPPPLFPPPDQSPPLHLPPLVSCLATKTLRFPHCNSLLEGTQRVLTARLIPLFLVHCSPFLVPLFVLLTGPGRRGTSGSCSLCSFLSWIILFSARTSFFLQTPSAPLVYVAPPRPLGSFASVYFPSPVFSGFVRFVPFFFGCLPHTVCLFPLTHSSVPSLSLPSPPVPVVARNPPHQ